MTDEPLPDRGHVLSPGSPHTPDAPTGPPIVIGGDVGGTGTRVAVADVAGRLLGVGTGPGGNPTTHGMRAATASMRTALAAALAGIDPARVRAAVFGMAGGGALRDPAVGAAYHDVFAEAGIGIAPRMTGDALVAFCSATAASAGIILLAGTGAAAAAVHDYELIRTADGLGWMLGDAGSGYWIGREAVRRTIDVIEARLPRGELATAVVGAMAAQAGADPIIVRDELIRAANARPAVELSRLAPLVTDAAGHDDPLAVDICRRAAAELMASIDRIADAVPDGAPIVLNGGVVRDPASPVGAHLRELLSARFSGEVLIPRDGTIGAAWLAVRDALGPDSDVGRLTDVHRRLMSAPAPSPSV